MKKIYLFIIAIVVVLMVAAYIRLFTAQTGFRESLTAQANVFIVENVDNTRIKIVTGDASKVIVDLEGAEEELDKISYDGKSKFSFSSEWQELAGTITVPEDTLLELHLSKESDVIINDENLGNSDSFLIEMSDVAFITFKDGINEVEIDGGNSNDVWDTDEWNYLDDETQEEQVNEQSGGEGEGEGEGEDCSIGSQIVRNYCCDRLNEDNVSFPYCDGYGHYVFNNSFSECEFQCDPEEEEEEEEVNCSVGSQSVRDQCCVNENYYVQTQECLGEWRFGNVDKECFYHCYTEQEIQELFGGGGGGGSTVSEYCSDFNGEDDKDECCDYNLRNELSIGPRPGFPDCIGRWYFSEEDEICDFRCAEYGEMLLILEELKQRAAENKEEL